MPLSRFTGEQLDLWAQQRFIPGEESHLVATTAIRQHTRGVGRSDNITFGIYLERSAHGCLALLIAPALSEKSRLEMESRSETGILTLRQLRLCEGT